MAALVTACAVARARRVASFSGSRDLASFRGRAPPVLSPQLPPPPSPEALVWGLHAAQAVLATGSRDVLRAHVLIADESVRLGAGGAAAEASAPPLLLLQETLRRRGVHVVRTDRNTLARMSRGVTHQGVVLEVRPADATTLPEMLPGALPTSFASPRASSGADAAASSSFPLVVALDDIVDPHNLGAVLRSALLLGADAVVVPRHGGAPLSATAAKASSGALEAWLASGRLMQCRSLVTLLQSCGQAGWRTVGTAAPPRAIASGATGAASTAANAATATAGMTLPAPPVPATSLRRDAPTLLVLGSEGAGLRAVVRRACQVLCFVEHAPAPAALLWPRRPPTELMQRAPPPLPLFVDSLNVSAAAAVLMHALRPMS